MYDNKESIDYNSQLYYVHVLKNYRNKVPVILTKRDAIKLTIKMYVIFLMSNLMMPIKGVAI